MSLNITLETKDRDEIYFSSIPNNFNCIAREAGIYDCLWGVKKDLLSNAKQITAPLEKGVILLATQKRRFEEFNADNGWGLWVDFLPFCAKYLQACKDNPDAIVRVSR